MGLEGIIDLTMYTASDDAGIVTDLPTITLYEQTTDPRDLVLFSEPGIEVCIYKDHQGKLYIDYGNGNGPSVCKNDDLKRVSGPDAEVDIYLEKNGLLFVDYRDGEGLKICNADRYYELLETQPVVWGTDRQIILTDGNNCKPQYMVNQFSHVIFRGMDITTREVLIRDVAQFTENVSAFDRAHLNELLRFAYIIMDEYRNFASFGLRLLDREIIVENTEIIENFILSAEAVLSESYSEA